MNEAHQQHTKALILGAGGSTGRGWEIGLLLGLHDGGIELTNADLVVGTSAGAIVGAQITSGLSLEDLYARAIQPLEKTKEPIVPVTMEKALPVLMAGLGAPNAQTARARIGAAALAAQTPSEEERLKSIASQLPVQQWPDKQRFVITCVNAQTGVQMAFDRTAGVPLVLAVSASSTVPGVYPPITIGTYRYIDGAVRSGTNADLAKGYQLVLVLRADTFDMSTVDPQQRTPFMSFEEELAELEQSGSRILVITPDEASAAARGPNMLDSSRNAISARAGREQGRRLAANVRNFWEV